MKNVGLLFFSLFFVLQSHAKDDPVPGSDPSTLCKNLSGVWKSLWSIAPRISSNQRDSNVFTDGQCVNLTAPPFMTLFLKADCSFMLTNIYTYTASQNKNTGRIQIFCTKQPDINSRFLNWTFKSLGFSGNIQFTNNYLYFQLTDAPFPSGNFLKNGIYPFRKITNKY